MSQSRLSSLALLSIEKEILNSFDFISNIDQFATMKTRPSSPPCSPVVQVVTCKCVYTKRNTEYTRLVYLALMFLCFHVNVLMWCSFAVNLLVVTLHKKLSSARQS